jgi:ATP-binding cassette subfamily B multidrug efflux pump
VLESLSYLLPYFRRYRGQMIFGLAAIFGSVVVGMINPLLLGRGIDALRTAPSRATILGYAGLIVGVAAVQGVFSYFQRTTLVTLSRGIEYDLRNLYFARLERQPQAFFQEHRTGDLMARATNDLSAVRMLCGPAIMYGTNTVFTAIGALFFMARIHLPLTLVALVTMPLVAVVTKIFGQRIHLLFEAVQGQFSGLSARVQENLAGVRVVRAYAQEAREEEVFGRLNAELVAGNRALIRWNAAFNPLLQVLVGVGFALVLWYGGSLALAGEISVGEFVTFNTFVGKLVWPMIAIGWVINLAQRGAASLGRMRVILEAPPAIVDREPLIDPGEIHGAIALRDLTFGYGEGGTAVLSDLDLEVPAGRTVALVGRTGAGKSTLLALLPRLIDPPEGTVFIDGVDVCRLPLARLRAAIAMVPQETFLFSATVGENIAFGRPAAGREEVLEAARLAGLADDLERFPEGLDTLVGERGLTLSGGQKQRVALARALLRDPRILLLDDCLSAVDTHTEETILRNLRTVFVGRTVFLVSHRISTVQDADLILVLDGGRLVERGTHAQLLAHGGLYADLHQRQMLEEELAAV